jgi:hypothetical protein
MTGSAGIFLFTQAFALGYHTAASNADQGWEFER